MDHGGEARASSVDFVLLTGGVKSGAFGLDFYGDRQVQQALGDGFLRVDGTPTYRVAAVQADSFGTAAHPVDLAAPPQGHVVAAGETWNFQVWYRDTTPNGFNLSDGLAVSFCPRPGRRWTGGARLPIYGA